MPPTPFRQGKSDVHLLAYAPADHMPACLCRLPDIVRQLVNSQLSCSQHGKDGKMPERTCSKGVGLNRSGRHLSLQLRDTSRCQHLCSGSAITDAWLDGRLLWPRRGPNVAGYLRNASRVSPLASPICHVARLHFWFSASIPHLSYCTSAMLGYGTPYIRKNGRHLMKCSSHRIFPSPSTQTRDT